MMARRNAPRIRASGEPLLRMASPSALLFALAACPSHADAADRVAVEVAATLSLASNPASPIYPNSFGPLNNALRIGLGLRAGVILFGGSYGGLYGGVKLMDYFGSTTPLVDSGLTVEEHAFQEGVEVGWDFKISFLSIRPQIGLGNITFTGTANSPDFTPSGALLGTNRGDSASSIYIEPGLTALAHFGLFFAGADLSYLEIPSYPLGSATEGTHAVTAHLQLGVRFGGGPGETKAHDDGDQEAP